MSDKPDEVEGSLVEALIDAYATMPNQYVGSAMELVDKSSKRIPRKVMDEIFKSKSKYYPQFKIIDIPIKHQVVHITPAIARDILKFSRRGAINQGVKNRSVKKSAVTRYKRDMDEGKWCLTGQPIIIGDDGEVMDGHSRLEAAALSKRGFLAVLLWGVSDALSFAHIDVGSVRSRAQVLEMAGVKVDANALAQTALLAQSFESTTNEHAFRGTQGNRYQQAETMTYVENNEELIQSVAFIEGLAKKYKHQRQASPATYAFCHYLIKQKIKESDLDEISITPEEYITKLISGIGVHSSEDIVFQVRDYLQKLSGQSTSYTQLCRLSSIFKGWNMHIGISVFRNTVAILRVGKTMIDEDGEKIPLKGAGNINEAFTVPFKLPGKLPRKGRKRSSVA
ncbi:chromosome partitioning protein ParB [Vibrio breoganii]|uniref:chromosome partitioning protein ParB n=1 Tax=Vibrio breoganii TaxID=553239 RepID=UPI000CAFDE55|nr:chromosome partitioning protein ParB [Vibrio breoganii]PMM12475.1 chromosome partitioning protein ParB [Vibrio breoganii]